jgi:hypothetical protein
MSGRDEVQYVPGVVSRGRDANSPNYAGKLQKGTHPLSETAHPSGGKLEFFNLDVENLLLHIATKYYVRCSVLQSENFVSVYSICVN